ncbi:CoiA-like protein [Streptococcus ictaluri 707-05]|uniref:CoiA-like protein n=1 Tax=Streptococcus ictaluri 707-05 TaxID=764299 RepID=G5K5Z2_9STRE|nr:CoiA-like protein [Streptococcus ictaluri 707-05]
MPTAKTFFCPACHSPLRLKNGHFKRPHFAHVTLKHCSVYGENESAQHLSLKASLYHNLSQTQKVVIEQYIPSLNQVADLLVNDCLALEVQLSSMSFLALAKRTKSYQEQGYQVRWLLGEKLWLKKRLTTLQKQFLYFSWTMGFHLWEIDEKRAELRLQYMIHEDLFGKVVYLTKTCSFNQDIMTFLRSPYQKQLLKLSQKMDTKLLEKIQKALFMKNTRWLQQQEEAYLKGDNILSWPVTRFFPQFHPITSEQGFLQIQDDLSVYYKSFERYYKKEPNKRVQTHFSPLYYGKMEKNRN